MRIVHEVSELTGIFILESMYSTFGAIVNTKR